ncbi:MAG: DegV family protein, partial [Proteobacteria bacterium]|nr:DegV family protein [Pseudomonadota bacterium]
DILVDFAHRTIQASHEYIFLDKLHYLAAGGRMSKAGAFMADMFGVKPIVTPAADGAAKVGVVRKPKDQVGFALQKMREDLSLRDEATILLQYTDNQDRLISEVQPRIESQFPMAEVLVRPLSFTTGVHCGPGTWAIAYVPTLD